LFRVSVLDVILSQEESQIDIDMLQMVVDYLVDKQPNYITKNIFNDNIATLMEKKINVDNLFKSNIVWRSFTHQKFNKTGTDNTVKWADKSNVVDLLLEPKKPIADNYEGEKELTATVENLV
jgi:hypothetical protein